MYTYARAHMHARKVNRNYNYLMCTFKIDLYVPKYRLISQTEIINSYVILVLFIFYFYLQYFYTMVSKYAFKLTIL